MSREDAQNLKVKVSYEGKLRKADTCRSCLFYRYYRSHLCEHPMRGYELPDDCVTMVCNYWRPKLEETK